MVVCLLYILLAAENAPDLRVHLMTGIHLTIILFATFRS
jgi:hypothetical protein